MAIVIAGIIGGVVAVGAVREAVYDDYSDYGDYADHSDYNDYAYRMEQERKKREMRESREELNEEIQKNVNSFKKSSGISPDKIITSNDCQFYNFDSDMQPMNSNVNEKIANQLIKEEVKQIEDYKQQITKIDNAILAINEKILNKKI